MPIESKGFYRISSKWRRMGLVQIWHIGVGEKVAQKKLEAYLEKTKASLVINAGFAGGLAPTLNVGDVIIDKRSWQGVRAFSSAMAKPPSFPVHYGDIVTQKACLTDCATKLRLFQETGALAIDMESQIVRDICSLRKIPTLTIRSVSDAQNDYLGIPIDVLFNMERQRTIVTKLIFYILRNTSHLSYLLRLFRATNLAQKSLTLTLDAVIRDLLFGVCNWHRHRDRLSLN